MAGNSLGIYCEIYCDQREAIKDGLMLSAATCVWRRGCVLTPKCRWAGTVGSSAKGLRSPINSSISTVGRRRPRHYYAAYQWFQYAAAWSRYDWQL